MIRSFKGIEYTLVQTDRKTLSIYVEPNGSVLVRAPKDSSVEKIDEILEKKRLWIFKSLVEFQELNHSRVKRTIANGEGFLFLGRSYRLKIEPDLIKPLSLSGGYFLLDEIYSNQARKHFINFYKKQGKDLIPKRVEYFASKLDVKPKNIVIRELRTRWASLSRTALNFHWKIMLAPISIIDYVIIHELAHLLKEDHSPAFWEIVESVMPIYKEKKNWLRQNGAFLDI
jgi:predicted metal-dependent hydrolase